MGLDVSIFGLARYVDHNFQPFSLSREAPQILDLILTFRALKHWRSLRSRSNLLRGKNPIFETLEN